MLEPSSIPRISRRSARASTSTGDSSTRTRSPTRTRTKLRSDPIRDVRQSPSAARPARTAIRDALGSCSRSPTPAHRREPSTRYDRRVASARRDACRRRRAGAPGTSRAVRIHGPSAVTATVCSKCADRLPSRVTAVQPSASTFTAGLPGVHHRLDREHHPLGQPRPAARLAVVRHLRLLVHPLPDAVADELAHHRKPVRLDVLLHRVADVRHPRRPAAPARSPCRAPLR